MRTKQRNSSRFSQKDPSKYFLYIADDYGQPEDDFPPLTHHNLFSQYDFPHLTLVQPASQSRPSISSNSSSSGLLKSSDGESSINDSSRSVTPSPSEVRKSISSVGKSSAIASSVAQDPSNEPDPINNFYLAYESLNLKSYLFEYYLKSGSSKHFRVHLHVSGEQIRFELLEKTSKVPWQQMSLNTQRLVDCTVSNKESHSRKGTSIDRSEKKFVSSSF